GFDRHAAGFDRHAAGFDEVTDHALAALARHALVVLDTTGASEHSLRMVARLREHARLTIVRVSASESRCARRVARRDAPVRLRVTEAQLAEIHARSLAAPIAFDAHYDNDGAWDELGARAFFHDLLEARGLPVRARVPELATARLVLRDWTDDDLAPFAALNADPRVMEHLVARLTREQSDALAARIRRDLARRGVGLFAVHEQSAAGPTFRGFVGVSIPTFEAPFLPAVEIGWRLTVDAWGRGLATEAARAVISYAWALGLDELVSFTSPQNARSVRVMEKLGMTRDRAADFEHPRVPAGHPLRPHVLYRLARPKAPAPAGVILGPA
ncbi:MAG: GNAT family N-acetyltransferase, partial [Sandaracinaceae bacterium]|nr:GNAT family N-acetyltransferase [Sandaracinaceae bacterium]